MPDGSQTAPTGAKTISRFVELLTGSPDTSLCWRFLPEKGNTEAAVLAEEKAEREKLREQDDANWRKFCLKRNFDGTLADVIGEMREHQRKGWGIFTVVNEGGRNGASITKIRALFIDIDNIEWEKIKWQAEPDFIVARDATHAHAYWRVTDCPVEKFTEAQLRLIRFYNSDPAVSDLPRVLRVPGTKHQKDAEHPHILRLIEKRDPAVSDARSLAELMTGLPELDPETIKEHKPGSATGSPVMEKVLRDVLGFIKSDGMRRAKWKDVVAGIRATNLVGDKDAKRRHEIAHEWMKASGHPIGGYDDAEGIDQVFDGMPPKEGGIGFGSLVNLAREHGYKGNPFERDPEDIYSGVNREGFVSADPKPAPFFMNVLEIIARPDPIPLVEGFLTDGEDTALVSPPKVGKTFIALDTSLSLASNIPVFGKLKGRRHGAVLYLSGEGTNGMKRRLLAWFRARGIAPDPALEHAGKDPMGNLANVPFFYHDSVPIIAKGSDQDGNSRNLAVCQTYLDNARAHIKAWKANHPNIDIPDDPVLVVIDTMARAQGAENENDSTTPNLYLELTKGLKDGLHCTVLTLAHCPKGAKGDEINIRGHGGTTGGFDAIWAAELSKINGVVKMWATDMKESAADKVFAFRLRKVMVPGMELGEGAVLDLVDPREFDRKPLDNAERNIARHVIEERLAEYEADNLANALTTKMLAGRLAEREMPPRPRDADEAKEWDRKKNEATQRWVTRLDNGSPPGGLDRHGKGAVYAGFYETTVKGDADKLQKWWFKRPIIVEDPNEIITR